MGREIRKVPVGWEHPKTHHHVRGEEYRPMLKESYEVRAEEWLKNCILWAKGEHPNQNPEYKYFWDYDGNPPDKDYYAPNWTDEEKNGFAVYETVSEGTPVSPTFATREELAQYLAENGDFWDQKRRNGGWGIEQARAFCNAGWAPSMIGTSQGFFEGKLMVGHK